MAKYRYCFFGDSITEGIGSDRRYTEFLKDLMPDTDIRNYGVNGEQSIGLLRQFGRMEEDVKGDFDCAVIFIGTNDFNGNIPLGQWFDESEEQVPNGLDTNGNPTGCHSRKKRSFNVDDGTFCGRMNIVLSYLRETYGDKRIVLVTPIHRGFAFFGGDNYQPRELYSNRIGEYVDTYIDAVRKAADIWACELIDLYRTSGFFPMSTANAKKYFHDIDTDRLHPNAEGHRRMAEIMFEDLTRYQPKN